MKLVPTLLAAAVIPLGLLGACSKPAEAPVSADSASGSTAGQGGVVSGPQPNGAVNTDANTANAAVAAASNSFTEGEARSHIEDAGYSDVTGLSKSPDGLWTAKAKQDGKSVTVALDFKGAVTAK